jgi:hypothetical protein
LRERVGVRATHTITMGEAPLTRLASLGDLSRKRER